MYPIIKQSVLRNSPKRGFLGLGKRFRTPDEVPDADAHHQYVYRIDGEYVLDPVRLNLADEQVLRATSVSIVDMRSDAPVIVELDIPSRDASIFRVKATFVCTVSEPVTVVREGIDATSRLGSYLKSHSKLFELGLPYSLGDINTVRKTANAQIFAFYTLKPPTVSGLRVKLANVEVMTPSELINQERIRRDRLARHQLETEEYALTQERRTNQEKGDFELTTLKSENKHDLETRRQLQEQTFEARREDYAQQMEAARADFQRRLEQDQQQFRLQQDGQRAAFIRRELAATHELIGNDPRLALGLSHVSGELTASELAGRLAEERNQDLERIKVTRDQEREDLMLTDQRQREFELKQLEADLEFRRLDHEAAREDKRFEREDMRRLAQIDREDRLQQLLWERDQQLRNQESLEKDGARQAELNIKILHELVQRGHLDMLNLDNIVSQMLPGLTQSGNPEPAGALEGGGGQGSKQHDHEDDEVAADVSEEDLGS